MAVPRLSLIAACSPSGVIGLNNQLPWKRLEGDLPRFKAITMGKVLIVGRKTMDGLIGRLPGRKTITVTRQALGPIGGDNTNVPCINSAIALAETISPDLSTEYFCIGGGELYKAMLPHVTMLYLTVTLSDYQGDVIVPEFAEIISQYETNTLTEWDVLDERVEGPPSIATHYYITLKRKAEAA